MNPKAEAHLITMLIDEIRSLKQPDLQNDLWDAEDIAHYLRMSKSTVQNKVLTLNNFPKAVVLPTGQQKPARRWVASEIKAWSKRIREVK